jgi:cyclase
MNRREFLARSSLFTGAALMVPSLSLAQTPKAPPTPATPEFKALRGNVGYFTARGGTIGYLANKDALVAIDTQFPDTAPMFLSGLPGRNGRKLDVLVNSHHHGDHTGGNAIFKPETKMIVAHANVPKLQRTAAEKAGTADKQVYAETTFPTTWRKELGGEVLSAKYHGTAHTSGDIVTHFEKANVIHMGDLLFNRLYPAIDRPSGASIKHWIVVLETVAREYPADATYIAGHGGTTFGVVAKRADLLVFRDYLTGLLDYTQKKINAGESRDKIITLDNLPGFPDFHAPMGPTNRLPANLGVAFDELTEKKA